MNKNITNLIATVLLSALLGLFLPWWAVMVAGFATALFIPLEGASVFGIPFAAVFLYWAIYSLVLSSANDFTLASRISELLKLGGNPYVLVAMTGIVGGFAAGLAGVFGKQIANLRTSISGKN
jgi:hypothetical protein